MVLIYIFSMNFQNLFLRIINIEVVSFVNQSFFHDIYSKYLPYEFYANVIKDLKASNFTNCTHQIYLLV